MACAALFVCCTTGAGVGEAYFAYGAVACGAAVAFLACLFQADLSCGAFAVIGTFGADIVFACLSGWAVGCGAAVGFEAEAAQAEFALVAIFVARACYAAVGAAD